jgi:hypothetical protein
MIDSAIASVQNFLSSAKWVLETPVGALFALLGFFALLAGAAKVARINIVSRAIRFVPMLYLFVIGLFGPLLWWPARLLTSVLCAILPIDWLLRRPLAAAGSTSNSLLAQGERRMLAERIWPPAYFPELYNAVPRDIQRPLYEDGRLLGGVPISWLADREMTARAYMLFMRTGLVAGLVMIVLLLIPVIVYGFVELADLVSLYSSGKRPIIEHWPGMPLAFLSDEATKQVFTDVWKIQLYDLLLSLLHYLPAQAMMAVGISLLTGLVLLNNWFDGKRAPYQLVTKDAEVRWPFRIETRNLVRQTYLRQIALATGHLKDSATYLVGHATGTLRARGDLAAPMRGQPVMLDEESIFQHLLVFGGTGEGKTTAILKPLMRQILARPSFGAFISDAKGVLWRDAQKVAKDVNRSADVILIGTGPDHSGVNIVAGLTPSQVSAALRSVLTQIGNTGNDSFWPDMAASIVRHMLTLGRGYALTEAGKAETKRGLNPYSLWWSYQAVLRNDLVKSAIAEIRDTHKKLRQDAQDQTTPEDATKIVEMNERLIPPELIDTICYLDSAWRDMAPETKTGIIANVTQLLDGFASSSVLRERFASGIDENCISMRQALDGKIVVNTLSSIEDGLPARLVSILIKTSLYREARQREAKWKLTQQGPSPQESPCLVVMDEVQELVTSDPSSGLSDSSFWNVARSSGLAGVFATQTVSALKQAMGEDASNNFIQQARSKVFFRTEEKDTVEYTCWCAGSFERNRVFDAAHRESIEFRMLIDGWDPLGPIDDSDAVEIDTGSLRREASTLLSPAKRTLATASGQRAYNPDFSFVPTQTISGGAPGQAASAAHSTYLASMTAQQAAVWRAEDLEREYLTHGNDQQPALTTADILQMGRWHAFAHIQRAGAVRQDLIRVQHDFS